MTIQNVTQFLDNKINSNEEFIRITFYEMRIKFNLSEEETQQVLVLIKRRLTNFEYKVYETGEKYWYKGETNEVETNELLIAIKGDNTNK